MLQPAQNANKLFKDFTSRINIIALTLTLKNWKVEGKEQLVVVLLMFSDYMRLCEIFVDSLLNFTVTVHFWVLTDNHELIHLYDASFINVT